MTMVLSVIFLGHLGIGGSEILPARLRATLPDGDQLHFFGVFVAEGRILTVCHALAGAELVEFHNGKGWRACVLVDHAMKADLALLAVRVKRPPVRFAPRSAKPRELVRIGAGAGVRLGRADGSRRERIAGLDARFLKTTLATTRGDSGQPVLNSQDELVGIISLSDDPHTTKAIDISEIKKFLEAP